MTHEQVAFIVVCDALDDLARFSITLCYNVTSYLFPLRLWLIRENNRIQRAAQQFRQALSSIPLLKPLGNICYNYRYNARQKFETWLLQTAFELWRHGNDVYDLGIADLEQQARIYLKRQDYGSQDPLLLYIRDLLPDILEKDEIRYRLYETLLPVTGTCNRFACFTGGCRCGIPMLPPVANITCSRKRKFI